MEDSLAGINPTFSQFLNQPHNPPSDFTSGTGLIVPLSLALFIKARAAQIVEAKLDWIPEIGTDLGHMGRALADWCLPLGPCGV